MAATWTPPPKKAPPLKLDPLKWSFSMYVLAHVGRERKGSAALKMGLFSPNALYNPMLYVSATVGIYSLVDIGPKMA